MRGGKPRLLSARRRVSWFLFLVMLVMPGDLGSQKVVGPFADLAACRVVEKQAKADFLKYHGSTPNLYLLTDCQQERK